MKYNLRMGQSNGEKSYIIKETGAKFGPWTFIGIWKSIAYGLATQQDKLVHKNILAPSQ